MFSRLDLCLLFTTIVGYWSLETYIRLKWEENNWLAETRQSRKNILKYVNTYKEHNSEYNLHTQAYRKIPNIDIQLNTDKNAKQR